MNARPSSLTGHPPESPESPARLHGAVARAVFATSFGFTVVQLDVTIVNVALPHIAADLGGGLAALQWIVDAYTLVFAVLLLSAGVIGDRYGPRPAYLAGFAIFTAASLACGLVPNTAALIAARALQGVGAALLVPTSLALLNQVTGHDAKLRARAVGWWTAAGGVSLAAGPVIGGLLMAAFRWRSVFLVNLPVCAWGVWLVLRHLPARAAAPAQAPHTPRRGLDLVGQILAIVALTGLTAAVIECGRLGLSHPAVLAGFATALAAGAAFVAVEARAAAPMLPLGLFRRPDVSPAVLFGVFVNLAYYGLMFVLTLYLQHERGYSALQAGLAYLPLTATFIVSNIASGRLAARLGPRTPMVAGALIAATGYALVLGVDGGSPLATMLLAFALIPGGMGLAVPAMTTAILSAVPAAQSGTASAVLNAARQVGGAIGVAAFGALAAEQVVPGLHAAAACAVCLLIIAAGCARWGIGRGARAARQAG